MALDQNFKIKDTLQTGASGLFLTAIRVGGGDNTWASPTYNGDVTAIESYGKILSGGTDLSDMFGDAVQDIRIGDTNQATIKYNTQNDTTSFQDVSVKGLTTSDSPQFQNLYLAGTSNVSTLSGAGTLVLDPGASTEVLSTSAGGTVRIAGDLVVDGTTTTVNSTTIELSSAIIHLGEGDSSATDAAYLPAGGVGIQAGSIADATIVYKPGGEWHIAHDLNIGETLDVTGATTLNGAVTIGDAGADDLVINSASAKLANVPTHDATGGVGIATTVLVLSGDKRIATDEIDSRVWGTSLVDANDSGTSGALPKFSGSSTITNSNITDSGSLVTIDSPLSANGQISQTSGDDGAATTHQNVYTGTTDGNGDLTLNTLGAGDYAAAELLISIKKGAHVGCTKILAVSDGTNTINGTAYGEVLIGTATFGTITLTGANTTLTLDGATTDAKVVVKVVSTI